MLEVGEEVKDDFAKEFDSNTDRSDKLADADRLITEAADKCLKEVSRCEEQIQERLVESYQQKLTEKDKPEPEQEIDR